MATYTPSGGSALSFHLLVDPPVRETRQTVTERIIPGSNSSVVDIVGKTITKIRGQARFDSYTALVAFEGAVGTQGTLVYSEEPAGKPVIFVSLSRNRVTSHDIHIADVEFWLVASGTTVQAVALSATANGTPVTPLLSARVSYGFDMRTGECHLVTPAKPSGIDYDQALIVTMGAGTNNIVRFDGVIREFQFRDGSAQVTTIARGYLTRAVEYENGDERAFSPWLGAGGILLPDIVGATTGTSSAIVQAVLTAANVPYTGSNIHGSSTIYGSAFPMPFLWRSGSQGVNTPLQAQDAGESAMSYIERYDAIDAEITGGNDGGRFRTFETLGGTVVRRRVGGRPHGTATLTLTEGIDILSGEFTRSITSTRNRFVVKGQDRGEGLGPLNFEVPSSNPFQPSGSKHTYAFSSDMIEREDNSGAADPHQAPYGMSCETLANALELEYNREIVTGWVETFRDDTVNIADTQIVQGGLGGIVGSLGVAEPLWVQSLDISVDEHGFTQRITYLGGGLE